MTARGDVVGLQRLDLRRVSKNGVSTMPGSISVTRTPVPLKSCRAASPIAGDGVLRRQ